MVPPTSWEKLEAKLAGRRELHLSDVPWPALGHPVLNLSKGNPKKAFRSALLRWHPDKFQKILHRMNAAEKAEAVIRVQEVTRRIILEKEMAD